MTNQVPDPRALFCNRLAQLEAGERAQLKRSIGKPLAEAGRALGLFYRLLPPGVPPHQEEVYFLVATLYPLAEAGSGGDLGEALRHTRQGKYVKGVDRRLQILLDTDGTQLAFRLRQAIRFLQSNRVRINWVRLLTDLLRWSYPERWVQKAWARSYFAAPPTSTERT